ncbi:MAG: hypothetical protein JW727_00305 [Candidatus Aenigmarchaeota archaeon]|nr:hypothetical protein [Candidatus Aenigmarchaeota archaeon]
MVFNCPPECDWVHPKYYSYKGVPGAHRGLIFVFEADAGFWEKVLSIFNKDDLLSPPVRYREPRPHCTISGRIYDDVPFSILLDALQGSSCLDTPAVFPKTLDFLRDNVGDAVYLKLEEDSFWHAKDSVLPWDASCQQYVPHITLTHVGSGKGKDYCAELSDFGVNPAKLNALGIKYNLSRRMDACYNLRSKNVTVYRHKGR